MSNNNQYGAIWNLLREHYFTINEHEHVDFICILCKRILIEAKQAPCSCRFCGKCIDDYLSDGNTLCPGNNIDCKEEVLHINENVSNDYATNRKISKLKLKCPSQNCTYEDILSNMDQHLMRCGKPIIACLFSQFGCIKVSVDNDELVQHIQMENLEHSHLMIEMMANLKNEIEILKKENLDMKSESNKQQRLIENLESEMREIKEYVEDPTYVDSNSNEEDESDESVESDESDESVESDELEELDESDKTVDTQVNRKEFTWIISDFQKKHSMKSSSSDAFFTHDNGYRIHLLLWPACQRSDGWYGVQIYPSCIKGCFDNDLQWPLVCDITIGIINQRTGLYLNQITRSICYKKSNTCYVSPFEFPINNDLFLYENSMKIQCTIHIIK